MSREAPAGSCLNGLFVAVDDVCETCKELGYDYVIVTNARTGRARELPVSGLQATDLVVSSAGAVASIRTAYPPVGPDRGVRQVQLHHRAGVTVLDQGAAIEPRSLTVWGSTLRWRSGGRVRSSSLRGHSTL